MADLYYLRYHSRRRISRELDHPAGSYCQMARLEYHLMGNHTIAPRCNEEFLLALLPFELSLGCSKLFLNQPSSFSPACGTSEMSKLVQSSTGEWDFCQKPSSVVVYSLTD